MVTPTGGKQRGKLEVGLECFIIDIAILPPSVAQWIVTKPQIQKNFWVFEIIKNVEPFPAG